MVQRIEIQAKLAELKKDDRLKGPSATVEINAPLALIQLSIESKIAALEWVLGKTENLIVG